MKPTYVDYRAWAPWDTYMFIKHTGYVLKSLLMESTSNTCSCSIDLGLFYVLTNVQVFYNPRTKLII